MIDEYDSETGHAADIGTAKAYELPSLAGRPFRPWHRPRKQFVRHYQWLEQILRIVDSSPRGDNTLRYLGLPGPDLLDLRYFHTHVCEPRGIKLRFLGFDSAARPMSKEQTALNISLDEVRRLEFIDQRSDVLGDDICHVANSNSLAWKRAFEAGPYDVINFDLCDGFGVQRRKRAASPTHFQALNQLLTLQAKSKTPWLLLLTTRVGEAFVDAEVLGKLLEKYRANLLSCLPFKIASRELFQISDVPSLSEATLRLQPLFLCGLCKWLLGLALAQEPPTSVAVESVIGYRVRSSARYEDLVSIAFRFSPIFVPLIDATGLARQVATRPDECSLSAAAICRIGELQNADVALRDDPELRASMIEGTASLLSLARYDREEYRLWARYL